MDIGRECQHDAIERTIAAPRLDCEREIGQVARLVHAHPDRARADMDGPPVRENMFERIAETMTSGMRERSSSGRSLTARDVPSADNVAAFCSNARRTRIVCHAIRAAAVTTIANVTLHAMPRLNGRTASTTATASSAANTTSARNG